MAAGGDPRDPRRGPVLKELKALLDKIKQQVNRLGKSYDKILSELYAKNPQKLKHELAKVAQLIEELHRLGINPDDFFKP